MPCRSEPAPGSVIAIADTSSPDTSPGSHRCFCSSVASAEMYGTITSLCTGKPTPLAPARAISSVRTTLKRKSLAPAPPYSSSTSKQSSPAAPALCQTSRSTWPSFSHSSWKGLTSFSRKARAIARKSSCSCP
jgi:hypothetical protein